MFQMTSPHPDTTIEAMVEAVAPNRRVGTWMDFKLRVFDEESKTKDVDLERCMKAIEKYFGPPGDSLSSAAIEKLIAQRVADAMIAYKANRNNKNGVNNETSGSVEVVEHTVRGCSCKEFLTYKPQNYHVKYATCTLLDGALTWWNAYVQSVGLYAAYDTTWKELKMLGIKKC
ncbi:hypothetical protein Tco_0368243 [Tanacetum coccineum]